jgi:N-acetylglutamate synthase-like GNAT family acetyltransferase
VPQADSIAVSVRRATSSDLPAIAALVNRAYKVESFFVDGDRTTAAELAQLMHGGTFLVLEHNAGGLAAAIYVEAHQDAAYIGLLSVSPDMQGRGLGKRLVRIAEALGEAMGCQSAGLKIVNLREDLGRWYRSLGYAEVGASPYDPSRPVKQPCHFIEMRRSLCVVAAAA